MPRYALAQTAEETATVAAIKLVNEGRDLAKSGKWIEALEKFQKAGEVRKMTPELQFFIGLCKAKLARLVEASIDLQRAVDAARAAGKENVVTAAEAELTDVRARMPSLKLTMPADAKPTRFAIDGNALATATLGTAISLNPGDHEVVVDFANGTFKKTVKLAERDAISVPIDVPTGPVIVPPVTTVPTGTSTVGQTPPPIVRETASGSSTNKTLGIVLVASGGAALVAGTIFFIMRQGTISTLDGICNLPGSGCPVSRKADVEDNRSTLVTQNALTWTFAGIGGAALIVGGYLLLTGSSPTPQPQSTGITARVVPYAAPGGGGAAIFGRF